MSNFYCPTCGVRLSPLGISPRELEVVRLVVTGRSNKEIGRALKISDQTVKNHITAIFHKLRVHSRIELLLASRDLGFVDLSSIHFVDAAEARQCTDCSPHS